MVKWGCWLVGLGYGVEAGVGGLGVGVQARVGGSLAEVGVWKG